MKKRGFYFTRLEAVVKAAVPASMVELRPPSRELLRALQKSRRIGPAVPRCMRVKASGVNYRGGGGCGTRFSPVAVAIFSCSFSSWFS
jgi:hypothetical protein